MNNYYKCEIEFDSVTLEYVAKLYSRWMYFGSDVIESRFHNKQLANEWIVSNIITEESKEKIPKENEEFCIIEEPTKEKQTFKNSKQKKKKQKKKRIKKNLGVLKEIYEN